MFKSDSEVFFVVLNKLLSYAISSFSSFVAHERVCLWPSKVSIDVHAAFNIQNHDMPRIAAKHYAVPPAVVNVARPRYASQNITKVSCFLFFLIDSPAGPLLTR